MESKLINGDSLEVLKDYEDNSIDLLCTDPPYGYGFMGKSWDKTLPPRKIFEECLRVLKPGSFTFVMSAPRGDVQYRMIQMLDEVGFEVGFTPIYWAYATGFPKALNVGKKTEKENLEGSYAGYQPKPAVEVVIVCMKPLDKKGYMEQAKDTQKGVTWLDDARIPFEGMNDIPQGGYGDMKVGYGKPGETQPMSKDLEQYNKDNVGAQENFDTEADGLSRGNQPVRKTTKRKPREEDTVFKTSGFKSEDNDTAEASPLGRFAANLLVSDDVLNDGKNYSHGKGGPYIYSDREYKVEGFIPDIKPTSPSNYGDGGSFSRYFSLDAWWENRVSKLPEEVRNTFPFLVVPKASKSEKNMGLDRLEKKQKIFNGPSDKSSKDMKGVEKKFTTQPTQNIHPTVKPFTLMSYLVTLGSRKDDVVLDPFAGSGTTGISCVFEDRKFICIEREKEYFDIMESRIEKAKNPTGLVDHEFWE